MSPPGPISFRPGSQGSPCGVAPFGDPRVTGRLRLAVEYRRLPRPSSPSAAKASVMRPKSLAAKPVRAAAPPDLDAPAGSTAPSGRGLPLLHCYVTFKVYSIFRFRLSKSFPQGGTPREPGGAIQAEHRPRLRPDGAASLIKGGDPAAGSPTATLLRLHPSHRPYLRRLPPSRVGPAPSGMVGSHDVTGGVYKARERIQGAVADAPLLAIPASCSRVAGCNPNWGGLSRFAGPRGPAALCTRHCSTFAAPGVGAIRT